MNHHLQVDIFHHQYEHVVETLRENLVLMRESFLRE